MAQTKTSKSRPFRVLSIDFDFFQIVNKQTLDNYPDGIDLPSNISELVWATRYTDYSLKQPNNVKKAVIDKDNLNVLKDILAYNADLCDTKPVLITQSHKHIYDFIKKYYDKRKYDRMHIVNIDMHHDMFDNNKQLDCGNWLSHIYNEMPKSKCRITWIVNPISIEAYGLNDTLKKCVKTNLDCIMDTEFDIIFLCRSDIWLPPHLDDHFDELYKYIAALYRGALVEKQVMEPRSVAEISQQIQTMYDDFANTTTQHNNIIIQ